MCEVFRVITKWRKDLIAIFCNHFNYFETHKKGFAKKKKNFSLKFSQNVDLIKLFKNHMPIGYLLTIFHGNSTKTSIFIKMNHFAAVL